jgi:glycosyltransferase involved in cell wall biosynthesis
MSPPGYSERIIDILKALPNVKYRGQVAPEEAGQVIANAAAFLSTSDAEGFPNTFLQAWASGTPIVSLGLDPGAAIRQQGIGIVSESVENAVVDLHALIDSSQQRETIGVRARRYVAETHGAAGIVSIFEHFLLSQINNTSRE